MPFPPTAGTLSVACSAAQTPERCLWPYVCKTEHVPAEAEPCGESKAERAVARWSCKQDDAANGWLMADPLGEAGEWGRCWAAGDGCWAEDGAWSVSLLDLPPAGDPGAAWATFDMLLPQIMELA